MSFRRFVYYSTIVGAWSAFVAWAMAHLATAWMSSDVLRATIYGLMLGLTVAFGTSLVDALWNFSPKQPMPIISRVGAAVAIGVIGTTACGGLAGLLFWWSQWDIVLLTTYIGLGGLVGAAVAVFDVASGLARKDARGPVTKLIKCTVGGTVGGFLGGLFAALLPFLAGLLARDGSRLDLWAPTAVGFVILGGLIGLLVGFSQVFLLEAWVKVEAGFRPGRDVVISRDCTTIGRGEGSDIALFGDNGVEKQHALIVLDKGGYFLEPLPNTPGTYVNEIPVIARTPLKAGDQIRVGKSLLRFNQRRKK